MKTYSLILLPVLLLSCSVQKEQEKSSKMLEVAGSTADYLQMTQDEQGNLIAWWVEEDEDSGKAFVHFSKSDNSNVEFSESIIIPESRDLNPGNGESMPKLIIKPDGTYVLIYTKRHKNSEAMFASGVYYAQSFDEGSTWSEPKPVHSDTNPDNSHGFPQAILMGNGEIGVTWLDGRHHLAHSTMYFAKTNGREGFGNDKIIGGPSCQCCKISMYADDNGILHIAYRGIRGDNIRDIQHITSEDNGDSFSNVSLVSDDNWQINACPHNGPSLSKSNSELHALWFTGGEKPGVYYSNAKGDAQNFSSRQKLTDFGKHLYVASNTLSAIAMWEEPFQDEENSYTRIKMSQITTGNLISSEYLSPLKVEAAMPYLLELNNGSILAMWTQYGNNGNHLHYKRLLPKSL